MFCFHSSCPWLCQISVNLILIGFYIFKSVIIMDFSEQSHSQMKIGIILLYFDSKCQFVWEWVWVKSMRSRTQPLISGLRYHSVLWRFPFSESFYGPDYTAVVWLIKALWEQTTVTMLKGSEMWPHIRTTQVTLFFHILTDSIHSCPHYERNRERDAKALCVV